MPTPWLQIYDIYLFDFDGLLVDTEIFHYNAYKETSEYLGLNYPFDYTQYCQLAHGGSSLMRDKWYMLVPELHQKGPWDQIYARKSANYQHSIQTQPIHLMPGAAEFLEELSQTNKKVAVVTHSGRDSIDSIKKNHPLLNKIPFWFTREDYENPKPAPDGYLKAISVLRTDPKERIIGFEDSLRGIVAQVAAQEMLPVHISPETFATLNEHIPYPIISIHSFEELLGLDDLPSPNLYPAT